MTGFHGDFAPAGVCGLLVRVKRSGHDLAWLNADDHYIAVGMALSNDKRNIKLHERYMPLQRECPAAPD